PVDSVSLGTAVGRVNPMRRRRISIVSFGGGAELYADPKPGARHLGHGVLPRELTRPAHHEQITPAEVERAGPPADSWPQEKSPRRSEGNDGHDRVDALSAQSIAVKRHAVAPIAVRGERNAVQRAGVARRQGTGQIVEDRVSRAAIRQGGEE